MNQTSLAVVGLGVVGSSIAHYLAKRGYQVDGYDQFSPPHSHGSSHGENRLVRRAPAEGKVYVELAARAYELWPLIEAAAGKTLFFKTGCLDISEPGSDWAKQSFDLSQEFGIPSELISVARARELLPIFRFKKDMEIAYSAESGVVLAEETVRAFLRLAQGYGAKLYFGEKVEKIDLRRSEIQISGNKKQRYDYIILAAGSWVGDFVTLPVRIEKRLVGWYPMKRRRTALPGFTHQGRKYSLYGMQGIDRTRYKVGDDFHLSEQIKPGRELRVTSTDRAALDDKAQRYLKHIDLDSATYQACKYSLTATSDFVMDWHPTAPNCLVFSTCSGHGFKYAPVYGEIADAFINPDHVKLNFSLKKFRLETIRAASASIQGHDVDGI